MIVFWGKMWDAQLCSLYTLTVFASCAAFTCHTSDSKVDGFFQEPKGGIPNLKIYSSQTSLNYTIFIPTFFFYSKIEAYSYLLLPLS